MSNDLYVVVASLDFALSYRPKQTFTFNSFIAALYSGTVKDLLALRTREVSSFFLTFVYERDIVDRDFDVYRLILHAHGLR